MSIKESDKNFKFVPKKYRHKYIPKRKSWNNQVKLTVKVRDDLVKALKAKIDGVREVMTEAQMAMVPAGDRNLSYLAFGFQFSDTTRQNLRNFELSVIADLLQSDVYD